MLADFRSSSPSLRQKLFLSQSPKHLFPTIPVKAEVVNHLVTPFPLGTKANLHPFASRNLVRQAPDYRSYTYSAIHGGGSNLPVRRANHQNNVLIVQRRNVQQVFVIRGVAVVWQSNPFLPTFEARFTFRFSRLHKDSLPLFSMMSASTTGS